MKIFNTHSHFRNFKLFPDILCLHYIVEVSKLKIINTNKHLSSNNKHRKSIIANERN